MLIEISTRVSVHAAEFGYLVERRSGRPLRELGRHATRISKDFPSGCLPLAFPNRLASHVAGLPAAIDPAHGEGALIVSPAYERDGRGGLRPRWVVIQRAKLFPEDDKPGLPGDATRSAALALEWADFARYACRLASAMSQLAPRPVGSDEPSGERLDRPRPALTLDSAEAAGACDPTSLAILGAVRRGQRLRLDERWRGDERDFLESYLAALACLPPLLRGHVSAAAGLIDPDPGVQIAWARDGRGLDPAGAAARALIAAGKAPIAEDADDAGFAIADDAFFAGVAGVLAATFEEPSVHALVRRAMRRWAGDAHKAIDGREAARLARAALDGGDLSPAEADGLIAWASQDRRSGVVADAEATAVLAILRGCAPADAPTRSLVAAVEICDRADVAYDSSRVVQIRKLAGDLFSARLAQSACPGQAFFQEALSREGLAALAARQVSRGDVRAMEILRRGLVMLTRREGAEAPMVKRLLGALLPRDSRIVADWRGYVDDDGCLVRGLFAATECPDAAPGEAASELAEGLIAGGKWNVVREALGRVVGRLGRAEPADSVENAQRLEMLISIAESMRRACDPAATLRAAS